MSFFESVTALCCICNLSHGLVKAAEYKRQPVWLDPRLSSSVVRALDKYLGARGSQGSNPGMVTFLVHTVTHITLDITVTLVTWKTPKIPTITKAPYSNA